MKYTPQHSFSRVAGGHFEFSSFKKKMLKVYRLSADGFGLSVQKSFRINGKKSTLKEQGIGHSPSWAFSARHTC